MADSSRGVGVCRHCGRLRLLRPRDLCWTCYFQGYPRHGQPTCRLPRVRHLYGPISKWGHKPWLPRFGEPVLTPAERDAALDAEPAPSDRVGLMAWRAARGLRTCRPDDCFLPGG